jgi:hypothetical protein
MAVGMSNVSSRTHSRDKSQFPLFSVVAATQRDLKSLIYCHLPYSTTVPY